MPRPTNPAPAPTLALVIPCYNEEAALPATHAILTDLLQSLVERQVIAPDSAIWYVDDGSKDGTWQTLESFARTSTNCHGIRLSRNRGHQNALLAGLLRAPGDLIITMDADLQDDVNCIERMIAEWRKGAEIVFGVRTRREVDGWFKRNTANGYYRLLRLIGMDVVHGHADFRLMSRPVIEALQKFGEKNLYLRGLILELGFPCAVVEYVREARKAGETKYPVSKMIALSVDGITSFSAAPLRFIALLGIAIFLLSIGMVFYALASWAIFNTAVPGWASTTVPLYALGGIQLLAIGVVGEYVAKIYVETKARPRYIVQTEIPAHTAHATMRTNQLPTAPADCLVRTPPPTIQTLSD